MRTSRPSSDSLVVVAHALGEAAKSRGLAVVVGPIGFSESEPCHGIVEPIGLGAICHVDIRVHTQRLGFGAELMGHGGIVQAFSIRRLNGEPIPDDVKILLDHKEELLNRTGIELNGDKGWEPWLDTSYLTETDWSRPEIRANVRAIADVCGLVSFIAAHEDAEYYGYWRGPSMRPVADAPLVLLDNEGQFRLCGSTFAEAVLERTHDEEQFTEMRDWLRSLGIVGLPEALTDLVCPQVRPSPGEMHEKLYNQHLGRESGA